MLLENHTPTVFSSLSSLSSALYLYSSSPKQGMIELGKAISLLRQQAKQDVNSLSFLARLELMQEAVESSIRLGAVYDADLYQAFFEASDALEQVIYASSLEGDYSEQALFLLDRQRTCWQVLEASLGRRAYSPVCHYYTEFKESSRFPLSKILQSLSQIGEVAFHLDSASSEEELNGIINLKTPQPMAWLQSQYTHLTWRLGVEEESKKTNSVQQITFPAATYSSLFLSSYLPRQEHYYVLDTLAAWIHYNVYQAFAECFSPVNFVGQIEQASRRVPFTDLVHPISFDSPTLSALPIRISGAFWSYFQGEKNDSSSMLSQDKCNALIYLGRDHLSSNVYVVESKHHVFVLDQGDCQGVYPFDPLALYQVDGHENKWCYSYQEGRIAQVVFAATTLDEMSEKSAVLEGGKQVVLISQGGKLYAVVCSKVTVSEAVCGYCDCIGQLAKNIWLTSYGDVFLEPWLMENVSFVNYVAPKRNDIKEATKNGYYQLTVSGVSIWLEASLVQAILPYDVCKKVGEVLVYGIQYFQRFIRGIGDKTVAFSIVIKGLGGFVIDAQTCVWHEKVSIEPCEDIASFIVQKETDFVVTLCSNENNKDYILNTRNVDDFVAFVWPALSLPKE
ncbi:hypothetical protein MSP8887_00403 [Marinomonas spartinae]|uniref:hypothetical protein n=1 Tax=Marinomonas spartinae TaxID=1792290 RepID=UPI000808E26A|nr:hypothetical protein [Marinomonas spartinae]SBS26418.1 hypothetical protein MSP8887_00403 [Marinomonas spartinae]